MSNECSDTFSRLTWLSLSGFQGLNLSVLKDWKLMDASSYHLLGQILVYSMFSLLQLWWKWKENKTKIICLKRYVGDLSDNKMKIDVTKELIACNFLFPIKVMVCVIWSLGVTRHDCRVGDIMLLLYQNMIRKTIWDYFRPFVDSFCVRHETIFTFSMNFQLYFINAEILESLMSPSLLANKHFSMFRIYLSF